MILMYHKVFPESLSLWWVDVDHFYQQLHALRCRKVVYLDDYDPADPEQVVITFDGVYRNVLQFAVPLLRFFGYPFELFVTSDYIGQDNRFDTVEPNADFATTEELRQMVEAGGRLQWHTRSHANMKDVHDPRIIDHELSIPDELHLLDPAGFNWFAYPHGEYNDTLLSAVRARFHGGLSCHQGAPRDRHRLNRITATNETSFRKHRISVIIASYNYGSYLVEAIESVLRQTIPPDEILISDDASTDNTWEIALEYKKRYPGLIRLNRNEINLGIVGHFNKAVSLTRGDYVCILGADNRFRSDYLEHTTALMDKDDSVAVAYTDVALFGPRAALVAQELRQRWETAEIGETFFLVHFPDFSPETLQLLQNNVNFIHGSSLFRRKAFDEIGGYLEHSDIPEDFNLFSRMLGSGWRAVRSPAPLLEYRQHSRDQANIRLGSELELQFYKELYHASQAEITRIKGTVSWRITAPLRVIWNIFRRLVN
jgi:glycosyltransferase involved in cell wall biosynthesis